MLTYVDTSVVLRLTFQEPGHLADWRDLPEPFTSELTRVEALRTLDGDDSRAGSRRSSSRSAASSCWTC